MSAIWMSYSGYNQYKNCPKQYWLQRIKKEPPPEKDSRHNAIVGSVVQRVFEAFYNEELYRLGKGTSEELLRRAQMYFEEFMATNYVDFNHVTCRYKSQHEPLKEIVEIIPKTLQGIIREKFYGPYAKSEVEMKERFNGGDVLVGYIDFVIRRDNGEVIILDGKSSRHREKNVNEEQLYFYALMFYLRYRQLPDKLGFFYYRFADDPELALDWFPVDKARIKELSNNIKDVMFEIRRRQYDATPKASFCRWCQWERVCDARMAQKRANREKRQQNKNEPEILVDFTEGPVMIGFGDLGKKE